MEHITSFHVNDVNLLNQNTQNDTKALLAASTQVGLQIQIKVNIRSCLITRMRNKIMI
jgi:hypothetical protein